MKKVIFSLLLLASVAGSLTSCRNDDTYPIPKVTSAPLFFPRISTDPLKNYIEFLRARPSVASNPVRPVFEFTIDFPDKRDIDLKAVEVYGSYQRGPNGTLGPRGFIGSYSTFPATVSFNSQEIFKNLYFYTNPTASGVPGTIQPVLGATSTAPNSTVFIGDQVLFTFEYVLNNGERIILTPLTNLKATNTVTKEVQDVSFVTGTLIQPPYSVTARVLNRE